jgi:hypothetical protein
MARRTFSLRAVIISSVLGLALSLMPLATAFAGGINGPYPH